MTPEAILVLYSILVVAGSLLGGSLPSLLRLTHLRMQMALSMVGGLMLGIGLLHLVPHSVAIMGSLDRSMLWVLAGLLATFLLIRAFHFHEHPHAAAGEAAGSTAAQADHHDLPSGSHTHPPVHRSVRWLPISFGLGIHTLVDGIALGAAVAAEATEPGVSPWGLGVFLAIVLHKPLDALSITTVLQREGWTWTGRQAANLGVALMCPLGVALAWWGARGASAEQAWGLGAALGFAAGAFICISLSDLLPELQFHRHDGAVLTLALLAGVALALAIGWAEPAHLHAPAHTNEPYQHNHQ